MNESDYEKGFEAGYGQGFNKGFIFVIRCIGILISVWGINKFHNPNWFAIIVGIGIFAFTFEKVYNNYEKLGIILAISCVVSIIVTSFILGIVIKKSGLIFGSVFMGFLCIMTTIQFHRHSQYSVPWAYESGGKYYRNKWDIIWLGITPFIEIFGLGVLGAAIYNYWLIKYF